MKIFVTGGAGFIGSQIVRYSIKNGNSVVNLDKISYSSCLKNLDEVGVSWILLC